MIRADRSSASTQEVAVYEDMSRACSATPRLWSLERPDRAIDHRCVPSLVTFFARYGTEVAASTEPTTWEPGDIVTWRLLSGVPHIGIAATRRAVGGDRYQIVRDIDAGPQIEDVPFAYEVTGHYRYEPTALT
ncbi:MAG: DUF1287 domain-containing protein [Candidatus Schekmanbacteria bacterium]|nr:DUF1287 domain-containing protein [Candidatus Schekmanbacteria bacterium]